MPDKKGLIYCSQEFSSNPFCVTKLIELLMSLSVLIFVIYDMVIRYKQERQLRSIFFILFTLMALALTCNIGYCLNHTIHTFNYLQGFFYNLYFVVIVYYVAFKLMMVMEVRRAYFWLLHALFGVSVAFLIGVLIRKFVTTYTSCSQLWYLVVSGFCIGLSIVLTVVGASYTRNQIQKLEGLENPMHYKNPLPNIWIWISFNIFSQLCNFIESIIFQAVPDSHCSFSNNFGVDQAVKLFFVFLSFHVGMISTIIFFRNKYKREKQSTSVSERRPSVNIELMQDIGQPQL